MAVIEEQRKDEQTPGITHTETHIHTRTLTELWQSFSFPVAYRLHMHILNK